MVRLTLLGGVVLEDDEGPVTGVASRRHPLALLAVLVADPTGSVSRSTIVGLLWSRTTESAARNRLSTCVHRTRSVLGKEGLISSGDELRLDRDGLDCDVWRFRKALAANDYQSAVEAYGGPFLDGFRPPDTPEFEKWADRQRKALRLEYCQALETLAESAEVRGDLETAAARWRERVHQNPYDSGSVLRLMSCLADVGNRASALRVARVHQRLLQEELGARPDPEVVALADRLREGAESGDGPTTRMGTPERARDRGSEDRAGSPESGVPRTDLETTAPAETPVRSPEDSSGPWSPVPDQLEESRPPRTVSLAAAVLLLVAVGLGGWLLLGGAEGGDARAADRTIAVLPFQALGQEGENDFAAGIHAGLVTRLAGVSDLDVISGTSVRPYLETRKPLPAIARELGARWVVEGEVHRVGRQVQINAQLVDPRTDTHLWARSYRWDSLTARNSFQVQEDLTRRIVRALELELTPEDERQVASVPTENTAAYELYLQAEGIKMPTAEGTNDRRIELYRRAIELDSAFVGAWAGLADAFVGRAWARGNSKVWADSGRWAARRALELDSLFADAHAQLGDALWVLEGGAAPVEAYRRALELQPGHRDAANNLSVLLRRRGELAQTARFLDQRLQTEPRSAAVLGGLVTLNVLLGRHGVADEWRSYAREHGISVVGSELDLALFDRGDVARARELLAQVSWPEDGSRVIRWRAALALYESDWVQARRLHRALYQSTAGGSRQIFGGLLHLRIGLAWALDRLGQDREAREIASEVATTARSEIDRGVAGYPVRHRLAVASLILGDTTRALDWLERAVDVGDRRSETLATVPTLEPLRDHPRFRRLTARMDSLVDVERRRVEAEGWAEPG